MYFSFIIFFRADIEKAVRKKKKYDFTELVLISKTYKTKGSGNGPLDSDIFYSNAEEQLFCEVSGHSLK